MQNACEPVHIQLNPIDMKVLALNRTYTPEPGLTAIADIFSMDSKLIHHEEKPINLTKTDVKEVFNLSDVISGLTGVNFIALKLKNSSGNVVSKNIYWLAADGNYKSMNNMQKTRLQISLVSSKKGKSDRSWTIKLTNNTNKLAFFVRPQLMADGVEALPGFWSANYVTLAPSETITLRVSCPEEL